MTSLSSNSSTFRRSDYDLTFKILVLGDSGVGKTSMIHRFTDGLFSESYISTIGIDSRAKVIELDGAKIRLQIWDTAGQERFRTLTSAYYRGAMGIILVYDITTEESFNNVSNWLENIEQNATCDVSRLLVGNKADEEEARIIGSSKGKQMAAQCNLRFYESSAKVGLNIEEVFMEVARQIKKDKDRQDSLSHKDLGPTISVDKHSNLQAGRCC